MGSGATIADSRRSYRFWVDDCLLDTFGPQLGPHGIATYCALARHAKQGTAFPALDTLSHETGMSRCSVKRAITQLVDLGLVSKESRQRADGGQTSNLYTLLDLSTYHVASTPTAIPLGPTNPPPSIAQNPPPAPIDPPPGSVRPPKDSLLKDTHEEGISVCVPVPQPTDTHTTPMATPVRENQNTYTPPTDTHTTPMVTPQGENRRIYTPFPAHALEQEELKTSLFTVAFYEWFNAQDLHVHLDREFSRWLCHGLSRGRVSHDFAADFRLWLLDPLTTKAQTGRSAQASSKPSEVRHAQATQRNPETSSDETETAPAATHQAQERDDEAARDAMANLDSILGAGWRSIGDMEQPRKPNSVIREGL